MPMSIRTGSNIYMAQTISEMRHVRDSVLEYSARISPRLTRGWEIPLVHYRCVHGYLFWKQPVQNQAAGPSFVCLSCPEHSTNTLHHSPSRNSPPPASPACLTNWRDEPARGLGPLPSAHGTEQPLISSEFFFLSVAALATPWPGVIRVGTEHEAGQWVRM